MRKTDNSPVGNTCPWIDEAIYVLEQSKCYWNESEVDNAVKALEKVRDANSELRDWGNELYRRVEELESEMEG